MNLKTRIEKIEGTLTSRDDGGPDNVVIMQVNSRDTMTEHTPIMLLEPLNGDTQYFRQPDESYLTFKARAIDCEKMNGSHVVILMASGANGEPLNPDNNDFEN